MDTELVCRNIRKPDFETNHTVSTRSLNDQIKTVLCKNLTDLLAIYKVTIRLFNLIPEAYLDFDIYSLLLFSLVQKAIRHETNVVDKFVFIDLFFLKVNDAAGILLTRVVNNVNGTPPNQNYFLNANSSLYRVSKIVKTLGGFVSVFKSAHRFDVNFSILLQSKEGRCPAQDLKQLAQKVQLNSEQIREPTMYIEQTSESYLSTEVVREIN